VCILFCETHSFYIKTQQDAFDAILHPDPLGENIMLPTHHSWIKWRDKEEAWTGRKERQGKGRKGEGRRKNHYCEILYTQTNKSSNRAVYDYGI